MDETIARVIDRLHRLRGGGHDRQIVGRWRLCADLDTFRRYAALYAP